MQNKYVGDIGDFGKYGLLREIFGRPEEPGTGCGLTLGVAWYLCPDEKGKPDGKFIDYLCSTSDKHKELEKCDSVLYSVLRRVVKTGNRRVAEIEQTRILPSSLYHSVAISGNTRTHWLNNALEATKDAAVVFVDPDNGIASEKTPEESPKHVFPYELSSFFGRGQSLVIYHHLTREGKAQEQINRLGRRLTESFKPPFTCWALRYRRGTGRVYFIVAQEHHERIIKHQLDKFQNKPCWFKKQPGFPHPHFKLVTPSG